MTLQVGSMMIQLVLLFLLTLFVVFLTFGAYRLVAMLNKKEIRSSTMSSIQLPNIQHRTYIAASPERVFATLTTGAGWDAWFTQGSTVTAKPGGYIRLRWPDYGPDRITMEDGGAVLEVEPNRRFVFQWQPGEQPTTVAFTLTAQGEGTLVELTESGYTPTPANLHAYVNCATGWGEALTLLKFYLELGVRA